MGERFAGGDELAFDLLFERHRAPVLAVCMGVLGTGHDAEDAMQETFVALAVALRAAPPRELRPWLARVARNAAIDVARRRARRALTADGELPDVPDARGVREPGSGAAEFRAVLDGVRELPEGQRTALLMRELGGFSYAEIAGVLHIEEDAVRGLIARARVGLRSHREATELPCATARAAIASEPDGRRHHRTVRRHLRSCAGCRSFRAALRDDARALRAVMPVSAGGFAGGGVLVGGLGAAKGALVGAGLTQLGAACAASVCVAGGFVLINPVPHGAPAVPRHPVARAARARPAVDARRVTIVPRAAASASGPAPGPMPTPDARSRPMPSPPGPTGGFGPHTGSRTGGTVSGQWHRMSSPPHPMPSPGATRHG